MPPRFFIDEPLSSTGTPIALPAGPARHVQVLRLQPGEDVTLFDGRGGEWDARIAQIARNSVSVLLGAHRDVERELPLQVTLALGVPANERMDALVEKATELGVAAIQPLMCERSVLRLSGDRAQKKIAHWQAVAIAACEQSGRTRVPRIEPEASLREWLRSGAASKAFDTRWVLSLRDARPLAAQSPGASVVCLSGPEGGLSESEERAAIEQGFLPVSLGATVLRADTAPIATLAHLALQAR